MTQSTLHISQKDNSSVNPWTLRVLLSRVKAHKTFLKTNWFYDDYKMIRDDNNQRNDCVQGYVENNGTMYCTCKSLNMLNTFLFQNDFTNKYIFWHLVEALRKILTIFKTSSSRIYEQLFAI
jgi:hypothetical protein